MQIPMKLSQLYQLEALILFHYSYAQQQIKIGNNDVMSNFCSQIDKIKLIRELFPNVEFIPFNETCKHKYGPSGFLLEYLGIPCDLVSFIDRNHGMSNANVRAQYEINEQRPRDIRSSSGWVSIVNKGTLSFKQKFLLTNSEFKTIEKEFNKESSFFMIF